MRRRTAALVSAAVLLASACTGSPTSAPQWSESAENAIGQTVSGVGTAAVVVSSAGAGRLTRAYAIGSLTDALGTVQKEIDGFASVQPPDALQPLARRVLERLHAALRLLVQTRTRFESPGLAAAATQGSLAELGATLRDLGSLSAEVIGPAR